MHPYPRFASAWKRIPVTPRWSTPETETGYCWFDVPLEVEGIVQAGFVLHGGCYQTRPDCHVTFEIRIGKTPGRACVPLMRIDWRSLNGGHSNDRRWRSALAGKRVSDSHHHAFKLNWDAERERMLRANLPIADELTEAVQTYDLLKSYTGKAFRINNMDVVPTPDWQYVLL